jgi:hypothetical protein
MIHQKVLFTKDECKTIINLNKSKNQSWEYGDRLYESLLIQHNSETMWLFDRLKSFFEEITEIKMTNLKKDIHYHIFKTSSYFGLHSDDLENRIYSVGVLLNDNFVGGDFILYDKDELTLNKKIGNTYIFDVSIKHEVTKIMDGERYSIIWFIKNDNIKIEKWQKKIF